MTDKLEHIESRLGSSPFDDDIRRMIDVVKAAIELIGARPNWKHHMASLILRIEEFEAGE